jgi:NADPH:quinone reductase-like Zn-dependent oxidoreductase
VAAVRCGRSDAALRLAPRLNRAGDKPGPRAADRPPYQTLPKPSGERSPLVTDHLDEPLGNLDMLAVQLNIYGDPIESVEVVQFAEPAAPGWDEALISVDFAPINPADLLLIMGYYAVRPNLPSVIGNEGVGTVVSVGSNVTHLREGDQVALPLSSFTWRERIVIAAERLVVLPANADLRQLAMVSVNPVTALLLLSEFKALKSGDWVVQNAANSGVGRAVIAFARERGLRTVNIVRRPELVAELTALGADVVVVDGPKVVEEIKAATSEADLTFALDCLSGPSMGSLASVLSTGGKIVSYGAMTGAPAYLSPGDLIYKDLTLASFFLGRPQYADRLPGLIEQAGEAIAAGKLHVPVTAIYPLSEIKQALAHARSGGKILLEMKGT